MGSFSITGRHKFKYLITSMVRPETVSLPVYLLYDTFCVSWILNEFIESRVFMYILAYTCTYMHTQLGTQTHTYIYKIRRYRTLSSGVNKIGLDIILQSYSVYINKYTFNSSPVARFCVHLCCYCIGDKTCGPCFRLLLRITRLAHSKMYFLLSETRSLLVRLAFFKVKSMAFR